MEISTARSPYSEVSGLLMKDSLAVKAARGYGLDRGLPGSGGEVWKADKAEAPAAAVAGAGSREQQPGSAMRRLQAEMQAETEARRLSWLNYIKLSMENGEAVGDMLREMTASEQGGVSPGAPAKLEETAAARQGRLATDLGVTTDLDAATDLGATAGFSSAADASAAAGSRPSTQQAPTLLASRERVLEAYRTGQALASAASVASEPGAGEPSGRRTEPLDIAV